MTTFTGASTKTTNLTDHPVKELIWTSNKDYTGAQLKLNGHDPKLIKQKQEYGNQTAIRLPHCCTKQNLPILARRFTALSTISNRFAKSAITEYKAGTPIPSQRSGGGDGTFNIGGTGGVILK